MSLVIRFSKTVKLPLNARDIWALSRAVNLSPKQFVEDYCYIQKAAGILSTVYLKQEKLLAICAQDIQLCDSEDTDEDFSLESLLRLNGIVHPDEFYPQWSNLRCRLLFSLFRIRDVITIAEYNRINASLFSMLYLEYAPNRDFEEQFALNITRMQEILSMFITDSGLWSAGILPETISY